MELNDSILSALNTRNKNYKGTYIRSKAATLDLHTPIFNFLENYTPIKGEPEGEVKTWYGSTHKADYKISDTLWLELKYSQSNYGKNHGNFLNVLYSELDGPKITSSTCFYIFAVESSLISQNHVECWRYLSENYNLLFILHDTKNQENVYPFKSCEEWLNEFIRTSKNS